MSVAAFSARSSTVKEASVKVMISSTTVALFFFSFFFLLFCFFLFAFFLESGAYLGECKEATSKKRRKTK